MPSVVDWGSVEKSSCLRVGPSSPPDCTVLLLGALRPPGTCGGGEPLAGSAIMRRPGGDVDDSMHVQMKQGGKFGGWDFV